ncbi:MAG: energy-coupling factor transporter transmembrane component T [Bacillota bacterium]
MFNSVLRRDSNLFLEKLHPAAALAYLAVLLVTAMSLDHPLFLVGLLALLGLTALSLGGWDLWNGFLKLGLGMSVLIMLVNPLMVRAGENILWYGPRAPVVGPLNVSLEAVCYGAVMSVKLLDVVSIFCLYILMVHPDRMLDLFSRLAFRSALVSCLAARMFPTMTRRLEDIRRIQELRGVDFSRGGFTERARSYAGLVDALLLSSLEDSMEIAEAMEARAFNSGRRSSCRPNLWRPRDILCLAGSVTALGVVLYGAAKGSLHYNYYPALDPVVKGWETPALLILAFLLLSIPAVMNWGWSRWPYFRAKI